MNSGMMLEDVLKEAKGKTNVEFYGRMGGMMPFPMKSLPISSALCKANLMMIFIHVVHG